MELKSGNIEELLGRFAIYGKFSDESKYFGFFYTDDVLDVYTMLDADKGESETLDTVLEKLKRTGEEGKDSGYLVFYPVGIISESEDSFFREGYDTVYVGGFKSSDRLQTVINHAMHSYLVLYSDQKGLTSENIQQDAHEKKIEYRYPNFEGELDGFIRENYVLPMKRAYGARNQVEMDRVKDGLKRFGDGSNLSKYINDFCDIVRLDQEWPSKSRVDSYVEIMDAIHKEDFERAIELRDKINSFK